ncbi:MAG: hypothetical protein LGR52_14570 [Candidatus Thiosymbion ectosymbiont of Robbea hypermnestra]|nr:hypothetical protein [Candidatus Thiosymbion ectosymbiont of Robbea hypermnestra]
MNRIESSATAGPTRANRPYPGLRPFGREESDRFFGREDQIDQLLDKLAETHFLAVLGTSGSGKSSLVRAGLLPALDSGVLIPPEPAAALPSWAIAELRPGDHPIRRLAAALIRDTGMGRDLPAAEQNQRITALEQDLRLGRRALRNRLHLEPLPPGERLLILVDQFEELFRFQRDDPREAAEFVALLLAAAYHPDCYLVITLRSEFIGDCARYPDLPEAINAGLFLTPRLSPEQLADAIQLPARLPEFRGDVDPGLARRLLIEAASEQDQLPLLQHLLMRLWDRARAAGRENPVLDEADLAALGGLHAALDRHAEEALAELATDQQQTAEVLFRALTERTTGQRDTRRPVSIAQVARIADKTPQQIIHCTAPFRRTDRSFLMPPADQPLDAEDTLDITHEALIRQWQRLRDWTADEAEQAELYQRLEAAAQRWHRGQGALWTDPDLQIGLDWRDKHRPSDAWAARYGGDFDLAMKFLDAGRDQREQQRTAEWKQQRRKLRRAWAIAVFSLIALALTLALAGWAWVERQNAVAAKQEAKEHAELAEAQKQVAEAAKDRAQRNAGEAQKQRIRAERAGQQRTEQLFESGLTHAALLAQSEDYAAAWRVLGQTTALDPAIPPDRRHARNLLAGFVDLRHGASDQIYRGADAALIDLALSPDGRWLAAGGERGELVIFDAAGGELVHRLEGHDPKSGEDGAVNAVRFTADGKTLISAGEDRHIRHWSVPDWQIQQQWPAPAGVFSLALSPDGKRLASAGQDDAITIWSMATGEPTRTLRGKSSNIADGASLAWLPDGRLISGGYNGQVGIWNPETGEEQPLPSIHTEQVNSVAVSPDGQRIATGGADRTIILWDANGQPLRRLHGHRNDVLGLAFDPSGQRLLSASYDNDLRLWDLASGASLRVFQGHEAGLWSVIVRDGRAYTAANDGTIRRWPLEQEQPGQWLWDLDNRKPKAVQLILDRADAGTDTLLVGFNDGAIRGYALPPETAEYSAPAQVDTESTTPVDSGQEIAAPSPNAPGILVAERTDAHNASLNRFALAPDRQTLATASLDNSARIWRIQSDKDGLALEPLHRFDRHSNSVHALAFSPDGRWLATAGYDGQVGLLDLETGDNKLSPAAEFGRIASVEFTPDGNSLITAHYEERRIRIWQPKGPRLTNGRTLARLSDNPGWATLSPDGRQVAVVGRDWLVSLYDLDPAAGASDAEPRRLVGHEQTVFRASFAPNGRLLATVSADKTLRVWDLGSDQAPTTTTGQPLFTLQLPTQRDHGVPLWDFDFRCTRDQTHCWLAVPLTIGRIALYRLPCAHPPTNLHPETTTQAKP